MVEDIAEEMKASPEEIVRPREPQEVSFEARFADLKLKEN
jgi:hypothetical protein